MTTFKKLPIVAAKIKLIDIKSQDDWLIDVMKLDINSFMTFLILIVFKL